MSKQPLNGPRRWRRRLAGHGREAASSGAACPPRRWRGVLVRGAAMEATRSAADWHRLGCAAFEAGSRGGEARLLGQQTGVLGISDGVVADGPLRLLGDATLGCLLSLPVEAHTACRLVRRRSARGRLSPRPRRSLATGPASALAGGGAEIGEGKSEEQMGMVRLCRKFFCKCLPLWRSRGMWHATLASHAGEAHLETWMEHLRTHMDDLRVYEPR